MKQRCARLLRRRFSIPSFSSQSLRSRSPTRRTGSLYFRFWRARSLRVVFQTRRSAELERLYTFGRAVLLIDNNEPFPKQVVMRLAETFDLDAAALYDQRNGEIYRAGPLEFDGGLRTSHTRWKWRDAASGCEPLLSTRWPMSSRRR